MVVVTELGREVPLKDWIAFHRDRLLSVLFQMRHQGLDSPGFPLSTIAAITGLREPEAAELTRDLVQQALLREDGNIYRLTEGGIRWVSDSPRR